MKKSRKTRRKLKGAGPAGNGGQSSSSSQCLQLRKNYADALDRFNQTRLANPGNNAAIEFILRDLQGKVNAAAAAYQAAGCHL